MPIYFSIQTTCSFLYILPIYSTLSPLLYVLDTAWSAEVQQADDGMGSLDLFEWRRRGPGHTSNTEK